MATVSTQDALGGSGSIADALKLIAVNGLARAVDGYASKKYPLTSFNETLTVNAEGEVKPSSAPQANISATQSLRSFFANPFTLAIGGAAIIGLIVLVAVRK